MDKRTLLGKHFLLRSLSESDLDYLAELSRIERAPAGHVIFMKDDPGTTQSCGLLMSILWPA